VLLNAAVHQGAHLFVFSQSSQVLQAGLSHLPRPCAHRSPFAFVLPIFAVFVSLAFASKYFRTCILYKRDAHFGMPPDLVLLADKESKH
jgi:hypothetical protein